MTNSNCLAGIACPKCGNESRIYIEARMLVEVRDDGAEPFGDMEWGDGSYAECPKCCHRGTLEEFRIDHITETSTSTKKE